jgi:tetratricopeptide (TPR) repeat protein
MSQETSSVDSIFCTAVEIESTDQRAAYLDRACADDPHLRQRVQKLLDAHFRAGDFLESPPAGVDVTGTLPEISEQPGTIIGRYKLMERIGEGGMGVVYVAEQREPVRRKVALKIIKPGMDTKEVIARFEAERQALALMDHPNIARVLDAGATESGRPYFVMELVRGIPITDYCDQNNLTARERLELFLSVCQAVQHAHQKGVIHRDVKPTNVLVTLHDGTPVPKIIDFGVAKAINQQLTERTVYTRHMQMIGTPLYMSPEQAELSGLDVDTRTDIYSLGVLLYELLTGTTPFDKERLHQAAYDELRRIIREEEPPKPSTRISTLGETATAISAHRKTDPRRLSQLMRGDLDWIVMKALEKDRTRRYETANGFARDVERYLKDEPVEARAPSALYRLRKFVRRNKVAVTTTTLVALTLLLAALGIAWERSKGAFGRLIAEVHTCIDTDDLAKAEAIIEELRQRGDGGRAETLSAQRRLAFEYAKPRIDRIEDAVQLMRKTLEAQRLVLGDDHVDTRQTQKSLRSLALRCLGRAWQLSMPTEAPPDDYERALRLRRLSVELDPSLSDSWGAGPYLTALVQYRRGDWRGSLHSLRQSLELYPIGQFEYVLLAMAHWRVGEKTLARDWYGAGCDWLERRGDFWGRKGRIVRLRAECVSLLYGATESVPGKGTAADYLELYSRLIETYPRVAVLHHLRGLHYGRIENWNEAAQDYARAAALQPDDWQPLQAWGAVCLYLEDFEGYQAACRQALEQARAQGSFVPRMDLFVLLCLGRSLSVDPAELKQLESDAEKADIFSVPGYREFFRLGRGMAVYRLERFDEAADILPDEGFANLKDELLAKLFRAMTEQQRGNASIAVGMLQQARAQLDDEFPGLAGKLAYTAQDCPVVWCMVQTVLREAEKLIEGAEQRPGPGGEVGQQEASGAGAGTP